MKEMGAKPETTPMRRQDATDNQTSMQSRAITPRPLAPACARALTLKIELGQGSGESMQPIRLRLGNHIAHMFAPARISCTRPWLRSTLKSPSESTAVGSPSTKTSESSQGDCTTQSSAGC